MICDNMSLNYYLIIDFPLRRTTSVAWALDLKSPWPNWP